MDRIHYAGDSFLTGTEIANALVDYAQALAQVSASAAVELPVVHDDGSLGRVKVLVGPASQLVASSEPSEFDEVVDDGLVMHLGVEAVRIRHYGSASPSPPATGVTPAEGWSEYGI
jgi:hypothetical protein